MGGGGVADKFGAPLHIVHGLPDGGHLLANAAAAVGAAVIVSHPESAAGVLKSAEEAGGARRVRAGSA
jgi:hypothetical protein